MDKEVYLKGALNEIDKQLIALNKRKDLILSELENANLKVSLPGTQGSDGPYISHSEQESHNSETPVNPYFRFLKSLSNRRNPIENPRVIFQGEPGAYSEMACINFFGKNIETKGLFYFEDTFLALKNGEADYAVLPIENSSTGAIRQVFDLLVQYDFFFVGETTVKVEHCLLGLPGAQISDIKSVYSHEQGLFQCGKFLGTHPEWKQIAQADTAGSAKMIAEEKDITKAAICSSLAAELYHLDILATKINENKNNTTRFLVISPKLELRPDRNKVCISLTTSHISGSLHEILAVFAVHGINLVRLESRPIPAVKWEYMFFIEFTGDILEEKTDQVLHELSLLAKDLRILGNFIDNL